jgi:hypothetical protein
MLIAALTKGIVLLVIVAGVCFAIAVIAPYIDDPRKW